MCCDTGKTSYPGSSICCDSGYYTVSSCPVGYTYSSSLNSCYLYSSSTKTWSDAAAYCRSNGNGRLVTISSQAENDFLKSMANGNRCWIGYNDIQTEGTFVWADSSESSSFTNWFWGEPNNMQNQDCGVLYSSGNWDDDYCTNLYTFLCESSKVSSCMTCPSGITK